MKRLPSWFRRPIETDAEYAKVHSLLDELNLHTVCRSAHCPNRHACWNSGTATVMILGDVCTRGCRFCAVKTGRPRPVDPTEPARVARAAAELKLRHVVLTSVTRDDLEDGGASAFAECLRALHETCSNVTTEVLIPDYLGDPLERVLQAGPDVLNHNLETVRRFQPAIRPQANYERSLSVLRASAQHVSAPVVKSGLMLGFGEQPAEVEQALRDLHEVGCRALTLGQYLAPTREHVPVEEFIHPDQFAEYERLAREIGFYAVASGPLVRSSYQADRLLEEARSEMSKYPSAQIRKNP